MSWAAEEFQDLDPGDKRRQARAVLLAERLADKPTASLPAACNGWAETLERVSLKDRASFLEEQKALHDA